MAIKHQNRPKTNVTGVPDLHLVVKFKLGGHGIDAERVVQMLKEETAKCKDVHIMWETEE